jgi:hypothetical protein
MRMVKRLLQIPEKRSAHFTRSTGRGKVSKTHAQSAGESKMEGVIREAFIGAQSITKAKVGNSRVVLLGSPSSKEK